MAACGGGPAPATFDLAQSVSAERPVHARHQLAVSEPSAVQPLDSDRILVRRADGTLATLARAQWSDRLPKLLQSRIVQSFERAGAVGRVSAFGGAVTPDLTLDIEVHVFEIDVGAGQGHIELAAKIASAQTGRVVAARIFQASAPGPTEGPAAVSSLDQALGQLLPELVHWAAPYI
jgi:cholesterol transport system auxiliary component